MRTIVAITWKVWLCIAISAAFARADEIVVDPASGPGADFTDLGLAIDTAGEGDTLLLRAGVHGDASVTTIVIDGKSLRLVAETAALVRIEDAIVIQGLSARQSVVMRGVRFDNTVAPTGGVQVQVLNNVGTVWFEDCLFGRIPSLFGGASFGNLLVSQCTTVSLQRCRLLFVGMGVPMRLEHSQVFIHDTISTAPNAPFFSESGEVGPAACVLTGGSLYISGGTFRGGNGSCGVLCQFNSDGGPGLLTSQGAAVLVVDSEITGGLPSNGPPPPAQPGAPWLDTDGTLDIDLFPGAAASLVISSPVREGLPIDLDFEGPVGSVAFLIYSLTPGGTIFPADGIGLVVGEPLIFQPLVTVPGTGLLSFSVTVPELGPGFESVAIFAQAGFLTSSAGISLSGGTTVDLLDASF